MPEYRAYLIGEDGHFQDAVPLICADDAEAMEKRSVSSIPATLSFGNVPARWLRSSIGRRCSFN
jgi:hypothetical protein